MIRNLLLTLGLILTTGVMMYGQTSALQGKVIDKVTKEPIPFANIILENKGSQVGGTMSDFDGNYQIKPIPPGNFDLKATFVGYRSVTVQGVIIGADKIRFYDIEMEATAETLETVEVIESRSPIMKSGIIPNFIAEFAPPSAQIIVINPFLKKYCTTFFVGDLPFAIIIHFFILSLILIN